MAKKTPRRTRLVFFVILVLALAAAFFYFTQIRTTQPVVTTTVEDVQIDGVGTTQDQKSFTGLGTLMSLQAKQQNLECQISYSKEGQPDVEGTYFISGSKMRGDFLVPTQEYAEDILSSLILDDQTMYVWSTIGGETYGFVSQRAAETPVKTNEPVPLDADVRYTCADWEVVDGSVFVPPTSVQFRDLNAVIDAGMEYGTPGGEF